MAFTDMNDVEQELGEEKPPERNNRTFMIIAGILGGIMVLALLCIAGLAIFRYLPGQRAAQYANETNVAQASAVALSASQTASAPLATSTRQPTVLPTNTRVPTKTAVIVLGPSKTPTFNSDVATRDALLTQAALTAQATLTTQPTQAVQATFTTQPTHAVQATSTTAPTQTEKPTQTTQPSQTAQPSSTVQPTTTARASATPLRPTSTALPATGIGEDLGSPGLLAVAALLIVIIFMIRRVRTAS